MGETMSVVLSQLDNVRKKRNGYMARCPAHDDRSPSLSVAQGDDGRVLLYCHAGCTVKDICDALGMSVNQLFPDRGKFTPIQRRQESEAARRRKLERKYELLQQWAFVAMVEYRDLAKEVLQRQGLDIPDEVVPAVHRLPTIDFYLETLTTGSEEEKLELLREGVLQKWARLYNSRTKTCQS